jgi:hypothetical protein
MAITEADLFMVIGVQSVVIAGVPCVEMITKEREVMPKKAIAVPLVELLMEKRVMWLRFGLHLIIKVLKGKK